MGIIAGWTITIRDEANRVQIFDAHAYHEIPRIIRKFFDSPEFHGGYHSDAKATIEIVPRIDHSLGDSK